MGAETVCQDLTYNQAPAIVWPPPFEKFRKIPRLERTITVTEKIDGTNAVIVVPADPALPLAVGSRNRWITPGKGTDNYDFARWVSQNEAALRRLGPGTHHGEWCGAGIARKYNTVQRWWFLFNTHAWSDKKLREAGLPDNVRAVPVLAQADDFLLAKNNAILALTDVQSPSRVQSRAFPGYFEPEGLVFYHAASGQLFKWTFNGDAKDAPSLEETP